VRDEVVAGPIRSHRGGFSMNQLLQADADKVNKRYTRTLTGNRIDNIMGFLKKYCHSLERIVSFHGEII
jgi:hypothetical protein